MSKRIHVVVLAGGYSTEVARGAPAAVAAAAAATSSAPGKTPGGGALAAVTAAASAAVAPALLPLDGVPAVVRLLRSLKTVKRVTLEAVWVVHNEGDTAAVLGPGGMFGASPASDLGLPAVNFLSNGASGPQSWRGEAADLAAALASITASPGAAEVCVAAISGWLAFMPNYNIQRLLEHSYLRGRDVLGSSYLNGTDLALLGEQGYLLVVPGEDSALPRIDRLEPLAYPEPQAKVAEPYLFLRPESVAALAGSGGAAAAGGLPNLAQQLIAAGAYVAAIDLMFGRYNLRTARAVDYADRFFAFCSAAVMDPSALGLKPGDVLQPYHVPPPSGLPPPPAAGSFVGRSTAADFRFDELDRLTGTAGRPGPGASGTLSQPQESMRDSDYEAFLRSASAFNDRFFGDAGSGRKAPPGMKYYLLPPTFYMTAYRRQGADIMF